MSPARRIGFAFDIDGVLMRGREALLAGREAMATCARRGAPFVVLTNGGGMLEAQRAGELSLALGLTIHPEQVVLSHTPMRSLAARYAGRRVLVIGERHSLAVAHAYGMRRAVDTTALLRDHPAMYPLLTHNHVPSAGAGDECAAVFVMHDAVHWGPDLQACLDVLRGGMPPGTGDATQRVPLYVSNDDLLFGGGYPVARLAGGAFTLALERLFHAITGNHLAVTRYGKPHPVTYRYAERVLAAHRAFVASGRWPARYGGEHTGDAEPTADLLAAPGAAGAEQLAAPATRLGFDALYMVGDNPAADIRGARNAERPWYSVLVRTGVFSSVGSGTEAAANDPHDPADWVAADAAEAVEWALQHDPSPHERLASAARG